MKKCRKCGNTKKLSRHHIFSDFYFDKHLGENNHPDYDSCVLLCEQCHGFISSINSYFRNLYWKKLDCSKCENRSIEQYDILRDLHKEIFRRFLSNESDLLINKSHRKEFAKRMLNEFDWIYQKGSRGFRWQ